MLTALTALSAAKCSDTYVITDKFNYRNNTLDKGNSICLNASAPHALVIFRVIDNVDISVAEYPSELSDEKTTGDYGNYAAVFFKSYALVKIVAKARTRVELAATIVPDLCGNEVWFSNIPGKLLNLHASNRTSICAFFASSQNPEFNVSASITNPSGFLRVISNFDDSNQTGTIEPYTLTKPGSRFIADFKASSSSDYISIQDLLVNLQEPTVPGFGYIKPEKFGEFLSMKTKIIVGSAGFGIVVILLGIIAWRATSKKHNSAGYTVIDTAPVPEIL